MRLGKFEGNPDQDLAEYLHELSMDGCDEELGDVEGFGWYGLLMDVGGHSEKPKSYIVHEDNYGFFDYTTYDTKTQSLEAWAKLESEYEDFESEAE